jgi:hypothetical protein
LYVCVHVCSHVPNCHAITGRQNQDQKHHRKHQIPVYVMLTFAAACIEY